jgi:hypothetical protein
LACPLPHKGTNSRHRPRSASCQKRTSHADHMNALAIVLGVLCCLNCLRPTSPAALQQQQGHTLSPWEQWYVLLHNGKLPGALPKRPNTAFTNNLLANVRDRVPRLRWEATEVALRDFSGRRSRRPALRRTGATSTRSRSGAGMVSASRRCCSPGGPARAGIILAAELRPWGR